MLRPLFANANGVFYRSPGQHPGSLACVDREALQGRPDSRSAYFTQEREGYFGLTMLT